MNSIYQGVTVLVKELVVKISRLLYTIIVLKIDNRDTVSGFVDLSCDLRLETSSGVLGRLEDWSIRSRVKFCVDEIGRPPNELRAVRGGCVKETSRRTLPVIVGSLDDR